MRFCKESYQSDSTCWHLSASLTQPVAMPAFQQIRVGQWEALWKSPFRPTLRMEKWPGLLARHSGVRRQMSQALKHGICLSKEAASIMQKRLSPRQVLPLPPSLPT